MTSKINKTIALVQKLQNLLPRSALITICKAFVRPTMDPEEGAPKRRRASVRRLTALCWRKVRASRLEWFQRFRVRGLHGQVRGFRI